MKIYTKTGDAGQTSLIYGVRVSKDDLRVEAYGTVDEANSAIGVAVAHCAGDGRFVETVRVLLRVQRDLFDVGRDLATPPERAAAPFITAERTALLERAIDGADSANEPLRHFILPGGSLQAAHLQHARTVVRRAERLCVALARQEQVGPELLIYVNRLSDLLFVLGRQANRLCGVGEPIVDFSRAPQDPF